MCIRRPWPRARHDATTARHDELQHDRVKRYAVAIHARRGDKLFAKGRERIALPSTDQLARLALGLVLTRRSACSSAQRAATSSTRRS